MTASRASLPDFEGREVQRSAVRITNAGDGLSDAMTIGRVALHHEDEVFYVLRGTVRDVNHKAGKDEGELTRVHTVRAEQITPIDDTTARQMLAAAKERLERAQAEIKGQMTLDGEEAATEREAADETDTPAEIASAAAARAKDGNG